MANKKLMFQTGVIEIYRDHKHEWRWRIRAVNTNIVAVSGEGYMRRQSCTNVVRKLNEALRTPLRVETIHPKHVKVHR